MTFRTKAGSESLADEGQQAVGDAIRLFLRRRGEEAAKKTAAKRCQEPGLPNVHQMRALDHMSLETLGTPLQSFVAEKPLKALKPGHSREWVDMADLPEPLRAAAGPRARRSVIKEGDSTHLEVIWSERRLVLQECVDMASKG